MSNRILALGRRPELANNVKNMAFLPIYIIFLFCTERCLMLRITFAIEFYEYVLISKKFTTAQFHEAASSIKCSSALNNYHNKVLPATILCHMY